MRKSCVQVSFFDTYTDVFGAMENDKPKLIRLLEEHINIKELIPYEFHRVFNAGFGRPRDYPLEGFIKFFLLLKIIGIPKDSLLLTILKLSAELREFCGFDKVPHKSLISCFRRDFIKQIRIMFDKLVDITEPICRELDSKKADYLIYDLTGIKVNVAENNPKFIDSKIRAAKKMAQQNLQQNTNQDTNQKPNIDPHKLAYALLPDNAQANPFANQQYINGHFCFKAGILTNGLGIVRDVAFFDDSFKLKHPEVVSKKTDDPTLDKVLGDSTSLKPVLEDFFESHPSFSYKTFIADSAFDSYDNFSLLSNKFHFDRVCIPINPRNSSSKPAEFDLNGTPLCPRDGTPFIFHSLCKGKNRSARFKFICPKSIRLHASAKRVCSCDDPCTDSSYGRCIYTYPDKNLRLYPGIPRGTEHWDNLYRHRVLIERSIFLLKTPLCGEPANSISQTTAKADLLFASMAQLIGVVLAHAIAKPELYKSLRKLIAA